MQVASGYIPHFQALKDAKTQSSQEAKPLRFLQKVEKPVLRPPTPSIHTPQEVCVWRAKLYLWFVIVWWCLNFVVLFVHVVE